ncbi:MAG: MASE3 domain-containing protein [Chloroflexota bacterium]
MAEQLHPTNFLARLSARPRRIINGLIIVALLAGILLTWLHSYLLFHSLAELFSVVVAFGVFIVAWNSAPLVKNNYLTTLGIGAVFIALIDLLHTLAYKGMGIFTGYSANLPTQLWLAARYLQALTLLAAPLLFQRRVRRGVLLAVFATLTAALLASIFLGFFPTAYVDGSGLTPFKIASEYVIIAILAAATYLLWHNRSEFDSTVLGWLTASITASAAAEFAFTSYVGVTDTANLLGHIFKIVAFYLLYRAVVETGFVRPYDLIFRKLKQDEEAERKARGEAEEQAREMALFPTLNPDAVLQVDADGRIRMANPAAAELGLAIGTQVAEAIPELRAVDFSACIAAATSRRVYEAPLGERVLLWTIHGVPELGLAFLYSKDITERIEMEEELARSAQEWQTTFDSTSDAIWILSHDQRILRSNKAAEQLFARPCREMIGVQCWEIAHGTDAPISHCPILRSRVSLRRETTELQIGERWFEVVVHPILETGHGQTEWLHILTDITERKMAETRIELERTKLKNILDTMSDGVYIVNQGFDLEYVNPAIEKEYGQTSGGKCYQYLHGLERICPWCVVGRVVRGEVIRSEWTSPTNGKVYELIDTPILQADGSISKLGIRHDITLLKESEYQIKLSRKRLQSLSHRLVTIQESERQLIARELHDEAGQILTSMKLDLHLLLKNASQPDLVFKKVSEMEDSVDEIQENLHRLASALRPASLDHLGLIAAIRQHVESVGEKQGIRVSFKSGELKKRLPPIVETVLYRIVQEAMTNIVRHANAARVDVLLTMQEDSLVMIIEDNGKGFSPENVPASGHLGLFGMRERAEMIGGKLLIESAPGHGTTVKVEVSYDTPTPESE